MTRGGPIPGGLRWTGLVGAALRLKMAKRARLLKDDAYWQRASGDLQALALRRLLASAAHTEIGKEHAFERLAAIDDDRDMLAAYRKAVPIGDWYAIRDRVQRMREQGEPDILWPGLVKHFAQTSGTTGGDKFIPVTQPMFQSNYRASLDIFAHLINRGVSLERMMSGRCLFLGGCSDLKHNEHGIITADLSGLVTPLIRWPLSAVYSPGKRIALIDDWPTKIDAMADLTLNQDIRFISGMPSWAHVLMKRVIERANASGIDAKCAHDIWPNLSVFVHGGVRYDPFKARTGEALTGSPEGDFRHRHELYPASEAFIAMQDRENQPGMRLLVDGGNFFEFVPADEVQDDGSLPADAPAFTCETVEPGVRYCVVLTTCAGLWRYNIGDVVVFEDTPGPNGTGPARLRIVGRHRHFINAFGENLIVEHIESAVSAAAQSTNANIGEFTAAPVYPESGRPAGLELVIESPDLAGEQAERFTQVFDQSLKDQNVDYTTKRTDDLGMAPPTLSVVQPGTFHDWMASRGKLGGQNKCPRCANHRDFVEQLTRSNQPTPH